MMYICVRVDQVINAEGEKVQLGARACSIPSKSIGFPVDVVTEIGFDFLDELTSRFHLFKIQTLLS